VNDHTPVDSGLPERVDITDNTDELARVDGVIAQGPYSADWTSLATYTAPLWYHDAKFGIFLHWGVYSVPAFKSEWYPREMYRQGTDEFRHHVETYGPHSEFGYKDFIPQFTMQDFDPDAWAALFRRAGAQFIVPVAEHHDGFAMYDTDRSRWKASAMGPKRDVFGDLLDAAERAWMVAGASSHRAEHWFFMNGGAKFESDVLNPDTLDFYGPAQRKEAAPNELFLEDWLLRTVEIIDKYRPQVLWFDWWIEHPAFEPYKRRLAAYYYNRAHEWQREVVINYKWDAFAAGSAVYDIERGTMGGVLPEVWQNDTSVSKSAWCFVENHDYKELPDLIAELADVVSKNGVLLLNIGPKADGTIPVREQELLEGIGAWLSINGEAIFGTRPWSIAAEGPTEVPVGSFTDTDLSPYTAEDIRFTTRAEVSAEFLYAILLARPEDGVARINAFGSGAGLLLREIRSVTVLGDSEPVEWTRTARALEVRLNESGKKAVGAVIKLLLGPAAGRPREDSVDD
jgi:alpha-L-fucosidase